ncbi:unnamed protein product [Prorocentrum cordatum]|uniref:Secreted protein n=1 Tax=Prorocentrum cordatum TaxID=2364126 RepID=A0ABN9VCV2_9DINO|nr:unnamed protein product [Polarella glacialis]
MKMTGTLTMMAMARTAMWRGGAAGAGYRADRGKDRKVFHWDHCRDVTHEFWSGAPGLMKQQQAQISQLKQIGDNTSGSAVTTTFHKAWCVVRLKRLNVDS